jgi:elongation factor G
MEIIESTIAEIEVEKVGTTPKCSKHKEIAPPKKAPKKRGGSDASRGAKLKFDLSRIRNIGIAAHVDAGKTTVTERILFYSHRIHRTGEVHEGTTTTDWMVQERERGITITSAATYCEWNKYRINIIDTPGHVDFTMEVERSMRVLDSVIAVFCAVGCVQSQSETVWRQADRYKVPRMCFINKMDRVGANFFGAVQEIESRLHGKPLVIQLPIGSESSFSGIIDLVKMEAQRWVDDAGLEIETGPIPTDLQDVANEWREKMIDRLGETSEKVMEEYFAGEVQESTLKAAIREGTIKSIFTPVLCGSAFRNKGIQALLDAVVDYCPSPLDIPPVEGIHPHTGHPVIRNADPDEPLAALAFKVATDPHVGRIVYVRMYSGTLEKGQVVMNPRLDKRERVNNILVMHANKREPVDILRAGELAALVGLKLTTTGDTLCDQKDQIALESMFLPEPVIAIAIEPKSQAESEKLQTSLKRLADEDPTFKASIDQDTGQTVISGMGELHLEIIVDRLLREFGVEASVGNPQVAYKETITQQVTVREKYSHQTGGRGMYADVEIEVTPLKSGQGIEFEAEVGGDKVPKEFLKSVEKGVNNKLKSGILAGYPVVDLKVRLIGGSYHEVDSSDLAFEIAGSRAVEKACKVARPILLEPVMKVDIETPEEYLGSISGDLSSRQGMIERIETRGDGTVNMIAMVPLRQLFGYATHLRSHSQGRASSVAEFAEYRPVSESLAKTIIPFFKDVMSEITKLENTENGKTNASH